MRKPELPRAFPHDHLESWTDEQWRAVPAVDVPILSLIPSQDGLNLEVLARLVNGGEPESGDIGRAVRWRDSLYLYDGHHRWVIDLLRGRSVFPVRLVDV